MTREAMRALPGGPLVKKYTDPRGVKRCVGLKEKLKSSQHMGPNLAFFLGKNNQSRLQPHPVPVAC